MARVWVVGPGHTLKVPSEAAAVVQDGDRVEIDPGVYVDCAVWRASGVTIEAAGPGVVLTGPTCKDQGIFVTQGNGITVRGITFVGAVSQRWHNGAGIRGAGDDLTVEHSRFLDNENGILSGGGPNSVLRIEDSLFIGNGACIRACAHGVYAGDAMLLLDIEHCEFLETKVGHHIKSRARNTIVRDSRIEDGSDGTSSYLIETPNGGNLLVQGNVLEKGPRSSNPRVAISIGVEGVTNPTRVLIVWNNVFRNDGTARTIFVRNSASVGVDMVGNTLSGGVEDYEWAPAMR
jgi:hypothetical protein